MEIDWIEFDNALRAYLQAHIETLAEENQDAVAFELLVHCNAEYGEVHVYLRVRPPYDDNAWPAFPDYPDHPPRNPDGLRYTVPDEDDRETELPLEDPRVVHWTEIDAMDDLFDLPEEEYGDKVEQFLLAVCRVALVMEREGAFSAFRKEPTFVLLVTDHDETEFDSWKRFIQARIEIDPPWNGKPWPIAGRHPVMADAIFCWAVDYQEAGKPNEAAHLLREAIARLPELAGAETYPVSGTDVSLSIPENSAWARAQLATIYKDVLANEATWKCIESAIQLDPNLADAYFEKAKRMNFGPIDAAELEATRAVIDQAIALDSRQSRFHILRGETHDRPYHPDWAAAVADYTRGHELDPANQKCLMRRAEAFAQLGDHAAAVEDYTEVFRLRNSEVTWYVRDALIGRAKCLFALEEYQAACDEWTRLITYEVREEYFTERAACHRQLGNLQAAEQDEAKVKEMNA